MSGPFSEQGKSAASCEPFKEWCEEQGLDYSTESVMDPRRQASRELWNTILESTRTDDQKTAERALSELRASDSEV